MLAVFRQPVWPVERRVPIKPAHAEMSRIPQVDVRIDDRKVGHRHLLAAHSFYRESRQSALISR
jgi:hypothetical protein